MGIWGKVVCGGIGAVIGGPIGALIGVGVGHIFVDTKVRVKNEDKIRLSFFVCFFACLAKVAKADGVITKAEVDCIKSIIDNDLQLDGEAKKFALNIVKKAKDDEVDVTEYIKQLAGIIRCDRDMSMAFIIAFHRLAMADNILHEKEKEILYFSEKTFRLPHGTIDNMMNAVYSNKFIDLKSAYEILEVSAGMSDQEIKKQYRKKCMEYHPDRIVSRGLPEEFVAFSNDQMIKIHDAYNSIRNSRRS